MGQFRKFIGGLVIENPFIRNGNDYKTLPYKVVTGVNYSGINVGGNADIPVYENLIPVASSTSVYDVNDYALNAISNVVCTKAYSYPQGAGNVFATITITITNNNSTATTINSIKFHKSIYRTGGYNADVLICGYFFDTPLELQSGETKIVTLALKIEM